MEQFKVIEIISNELRGSTIVRALFLSGSHGNGMADEFSDIDFILVAEDGASDEVSQLWRSAVRQTGEFVLWRDRTTQPTLINAITDDWTRTDLIILKPDQIGAHNQASLKPLIDRDNLFQSLSNAVEHALPDQARLRYQFEEFIRILGLLRLAVGREEFITGVAGVFHLRNLLVELLIVETAAPHRGGVLHLNRLLTDEQKALLVSLPPAIASRESMITAHLAYAKAYLPRARELALQYEIDWPEHFEKVTWALLNATLVIDCPYRVE